MTGVEAPTSRMLVKPACRVFLADTVASMASSSSVRVTASRIGSPLCQVAVMWSWQSISPGSTVLSERSITSAPGGLVKPGWTAAIRASWTRMVTWLRSVLVTPSISRPAWMARSLA